jgi:hypothetical protein
VSHGLGGSSSRSVARQRWIQANGRNAQIAHRIWDHAGVGDRVTVVVGHLGVKFPGAPQYRAYLKQQDGKGWRTTEHKTHVEYQSLITDLVLESECFGGRVG